MIRYALKCEADHGFESWFADAAAFDRLARVAQLSCPVCGSAKVEKALMVPAVKAKTESAPTPRPSLSTPASEVEQALAALRRKVEENSEYVGVNFVTEARRMHEGDAPERAIYGEAKPEEARKLMEDGVPVAPLPFLPGRKAN